MSEWIRSRDRKTWPLKGFGHCGKVAISGGLTVSFLKIFCHLCPLESTFALSGRTCINRVNLSFKEFTLWDFALNGVATLREFSNKEIFLVL